MEMVVVMGMITTLSTIGIYFVTPLYKEKARGSTCRSHVLGLHRALKMYVNDNDGTLPPWKSEKINMMWNPNNKNWLAKKSITRWSDLLTQYVYSKEVFHCPGMHERGMSPADFGMNTGLSPQSATHGLTEKIDEADVENPSSTLIFGDADIVTNKSQAWAMMSSDPDEWKADPKHRGGSMTMNPHLFSQSQHRLINRHRGKSNVVFMDGHVETLPASALGFQYPEKHQLAKWDLH